MISCVLRHQNKAILSTPATIPPRSSHPDFAGTAIYHFLVLDSTNAFAMRLLQKGHPREGTIILAAHQTAGRGQSGRRWYDAPGQNICLTRILYPDIAPQQQFLLNIATAIAVRDTIQAYCPAGTIMIKWPNDVYVGDRKIAGILIQTTIQGQRVTSCAAGIGINVFETDFPEDLPNPTSLRLERRRLTASSHPPALRVPLRKYEVQDTLMLELTARFRQMHHDAESLHEEYHTHLYRRNMPAVFHHDKTTRAGVITGVETDGRLRIRWDNGEQGRYLHGEVELIM